MWTITQNGFTSVVAYDARKDQNKKSAHRKIAPNPGTHLLVRARVEEDLEVLRSVVPNLVIETDPRADYSYRCVVSRDLFKQYMASEIDAIDYGAHFKEQFASNAHEGHKRYSQLMSMWTLMASWQRFAPYTGHDRWKGSKKSTKTSFGNTNQTAFDDDWSDYDLAEGSGALSQFASETAASITVDALKDILKDRGPEGLTLSEIAGLDDDAWVLQQKADEFEAELTDAVIDELALQATWEGSTTAEKEIWIDAQAALPNDPSIRKEAQEIENNLINKD